MNSHEQNRRVWNERARRQDWYVDTATERDFADPLAGVDQCGWLGRDVKGKRLLCLAAGGGRHSALFAIAGALVTVVDISEEMLALDRRLAAEKNLHIEIVQASMDDLAPIADQQFEIIVQPVSTCYVPDIVAVYREVARVIRPGGIYISQHKQPVNLQASVLPSQGGYALSEAYYRTGALPALIERSWHREAGAAEFLHRWEHLSGGLCRSGFVIEDVAEPNHADANVPPGSFGHRSCYVPPYIKIKARRNEDNFKERRVWTPG